MAFHGKTALVTGAGSGMGQRAAERLAAQGAIVAALDINEEGLAATASSSEQIHTYAIDVTDTQGVEEVIGKFTADHGPVDRVMAAAGIMPSASVSDMPTATILKTMDVNYAGVVNVVKPTLDSMLERGRGEMVIFASLVGHQPVLNQSAYTASKFAVRAFAEVLHHENIDSGVKFVCVCPPAVATPLIDQLDDAGRHFMDQVPARFRTTTSDKVLDAVEKGLDKGKFWVMPGIARGAANYYRLAPRLYWKGFDKLYRQHLEGTTKS